MLESEVKAQIKEYLEKAGWFTWHNTAGKWSKKGVCDRYAIKNGRVFFIEVKAPGGTQSPEQIKFEMDILRHGGKYICVHSLEALKIAIGE